MASTSPEARALLQVLRRSRGLQRLPHVWHSPTEERQGARPAFLLPGNPGSELIAEGLLFLLRNESTGIM